MGMKEYEGKKIYVVLNSKRRYTGTVKSVDFMGKDTNDIEVWMFTILDKFGAIVSFSNREINVIEEERTFDGRKT
jgi:hypothetical protein